MFFFDVFVFAFTSFHVMWVFISDMKGDEMTAMLNANVMGLALCSSLAAKSMLARGITDGHIINISRCVNSKQLRILH